MPPNRNTTHRNLVLARAVGAPLQLWQQPEYFFGNRQVNMAASKSTEILSINHQDNGECLETTPGERFTIRTSAKETKGVYTMLEVVADPRNGMPIHVHKNEDEHLLVLEGTLHIVVGDAALDVPAGTAFTVSRGDPHAWCNLTEMPVRMLLISSPGHIEGLFGELAARKSDDDLAAIT